MPTPAAYNEHIRAQVAHLTDVTKFLTRAQLANELGCGTQSIGRKIRGESAFSAYEVAYLANRYGVEVQLGKNQLAFSLPLDFEVEPTGQRYVDSLREVGRQIEASAADRDDISLRATNGRVPVAWLLSEPTLALLKLYEYDYALKVAPVPFDLPDLSRVHADYLREARQRYEYYAAIDSEEITGQAPFEDLLATVRRFAERRLIDAAGLRAIREAFQSLLERMSTALRTGRKELGGKFKLFDSPHHGLATLITIRTSRANYALIRLTDPLYGLSNQAYTAEACNRIIDLAKAKSALLGGDGSGAYRQWFARQAQDIDRGMERCMAMLAE